MNKEKLKSGAIEILGWLLLLVGIVALVLPGPGLLALFAGLALLSRRNKWARRRLEPVRKAAQEAARSGVSSPTRLLGSILAILALIGVGIIWGLRPSPPSWWPLAEKYWLIGGWGTGTTLIASGIIAAVMLIYSYVRFRKS